MRYRLLILIIIMTISGFTYGEESSAEITEATQNEVFKDASQLFAAGKYQSVIQELTAVETRLQTSGKLSKQMNGLISYWRGICHNKSQNFSEAIIQFGKALSLGLSPVDLSYEYGQALFAAEKLTEARLQFRESLKRKFKRGVSLYYIAYISKELGDNKKAVTFYKAIDKLGPEEAKEVKQAAEMQIGDIYLEQVEKHQRSFNSIEKYVIPQYRAALAIDKNSALAPEIQDKITKLENKYDLVLFKLRNGRPALVPPYFLRLALESGVDSNVTFSPTEQEIDESKKSSSFLRADVMGRYTFYFKNFISVAPEFRANMTRYNNRDPGIFRNDNYLLMPSLRTSVEHSLWGRPAATMLDYEFNQASRDITANEKFDFSFRSHALTLGERFYFFSAGETILRLRRRLFESYLSASDSTTTSLLLEQIASFRSSTFVFFTSFDATRVQDESFDTNAVTLRGDVILGDIKNWFTPTIGIGVTSTDPINNPSRGRELLINPSGRLSRVLSKNLRGNLKFDYQNNKSKDEENFAYSKYIYSFELEYVF